MSSNLVNVRDEVYSKLLAKKTANGFANNSFDLAKTWLPSELLETLVQTYTNGKVYVIAHTPGDVGMPITKGPSKAVTREFSVWVGFQKAITDVESISELDANSLLVEQMEDVCRKDFALSPFQFMRIEYLKDERGYPQSYVVQRKTLVYETYFIAFYQRVIT